MRREPGTGRHGKRPPNVTPHGMGGMPETVTGPSAVVVGPPEVAWGGCVIRVSLFVLSPDAGIEKVIGDVVRALAAESTMGVAAGETPAPRAASRPALLRHTAEPDASAPGGGAAAAVMTGATDYTEHGSLDDLTARELQVLDLVARGLDNAAIALELGISSRTVRNHLNSVFSKLNVDYRPQAVVLAREAGLGRT